MSNKRKGGEFLGEGSYGCVYKDNKNIVKILFNNEKFIKEVMRTLLINKIDKTITSSRIENIQSLKIKDITDKGLLEDLNKCDLLKRKYHNVKNIYKIIYNIKYFGIDLYNISEKKIISLDKILALSLRLYEVLELYNNFRVIHSDIKPDNMLYLKESEILIFIDFGLLKTYDNIFLDKSLLNHKYYYYPPEFKLVVALIENKSLDEFIYHFSENLNANYSFSKYTDILLENYKDSDKDLSNLYNTNYKLYNKYIDEYNNTYTYNKIAINNSNNSNNDIKSYQYDIINKLFNDDDKDKIDLYGLSISMYEIIMLYVDNNKELIEDNNFILDYIKYIIIPSIKFDNRKRSTVKETIDAFKKLKHKNDDLNKILKQIPLKDAINQQTNTISKESIVKPNIFKQDIIPEPIEKPNISESTPTSTSLNTTPKSVKTDCERNNRSYLLDIAKEKKIKYRHRMNKEVLCKNIDLHK